MKAGNIQHLDKHRVANSFKASGDTYEESATVQKEISHRLVTLMEDCDSIKYSRVLEIGCCTGVLTELVSSTHRIATLFANDIVSDFCSSTAKRVEKHIGRVEMLPGDIEKIALPQNLDLVMSSSTFQWMTDLQTLFEKIQASLNNGGYLVFSIFSPGTMEEISALTGQGLQYHCMEGITEMLHDSFRIITSHTEKKRLYFPTVRAVLRHIRETGVGGLGRSKWSHGMLREFEKQYRCRFSMEGGLPVTYASIFVVAEKKFK